MKIEELKEDEMYVLCAPDGSTQLMTLSPDYAMCVAMIRILHKAKISESFHELMMVKGFKIMPVKVTITQNGDEESAFASAKAKLKQ